VSFFETVGLKKGHRRLSVTRSCISIGVVSDVAADGMVIASSISAEDGARYTRRRSKFSGSTIIIIMNKKQSARLNAYLAVQTLLAANAETVATLPALDEAAFPEVERLLSQRVDKLLWQFRASALEFYERYQVARAVVNGATFPADGVTTPPVPVAA